MVNPQVYCGYRLGVIVPPFQKNMYSGFQMKRAIFGCYLRYKHFREMESLLFLEMIGNPQKN